MEIRSLHPTARMLILVNAVAPITSWLQSCDDASGEGPNDLLCTLWVDNVGRVHSG